MNIKKLLKLYFTSDIERQINRLKGALEEIEYSLSSSRTDKIAVGGSGTADTVANYVAGEQEERERRKIARERLALVELKKKLDYLFDKANIISDDDLQLIKLIYKNNLSIREATKRTAKSYRQNLKRHKEAIKTIRFLIS